MKPNRTPCKWNRMQVASFLLIFHIHLVTAQDALRLPPGVEKITSVEGITEYGLPNGLRILLFPDLSKPTITVNITYKVGSRQEGYGEKGMAHLLEHMVFKGTPRHSNISQELTEHGSSANGTTWFDRTNYYETFDATEQNLRWALDLEADRMVNSFIARKDLESEFTVVRNEYEAGENFPQRVLHKRMLATVFQWHNYGRDTIGEKSDIEGAPIERLQAFYRTHYQPDNAVLVVAGKIDERKTLELVYEYFAKIPKPSRQLIPTYTKEPTQDGERQITLRRTGDVQLCSCMYRTVAGSHLDYAALSVLGDLLTDAPSGRLYKALVETKMAARVSGGASGFAEGGLLELVAQVRLEQSVDAAKTVMLAVLDGLKSSPPTLEEVDKAKTRLLKSFELLLRQSEWVGLELSEYIAMGDWRLAFLYRDNVEKVTPEEVSRVARHYLKQSNRTLGLFIPESRADRAAVPDAPDLAMLLKDYKGKASLSQGEDFDPTPENLERRVVRGNLPNGMRYALLPKKTRGHGIQGMLTLRVGTLESLKGKSIIPAAVGTMLPRGTLTKSRQQIQDTLDKWKARINVNGAGNVAIETDRERVADVIRLAREILREPSFPADEFDKLKQERLAFIEQQKSQPNALANRLFRDISRPPYPKDDPRFAMTFEEQAAAIQALTLEQVKDFYKQFYGASYATAALVGDFDPKEIEKLLAESFGDWRNPSEFARIRADYEPVPARAESINTPDKANAVYIAGYGVAMRDDDPDYLAVTLGGEMLGGGFLSSRLGIRIRQKDGLSYGVGGNFSADPQDKNGSFRFFMIYNPQNLAKLEIAFREEIERAAKDGFIAQELETARTGWLNSRKVERSDDTSLARVLNNYLFIGRDFSWDAKQEETARRLSLEQVNAAMKKYLGYSRMITVRAGDFQKSQKSSQP
ncbi:MAG: insulinase family protein [Verrucomicrobia bacterium]|nr:insulinase family protein [Verrucomicrobiota bacterium]